MGMEAYALYSIDELRRDNPSDGKSITALPVYYNTVQYDERLYPYGQDLNAMRETLLTIAEKLGIDTTSVEIQDDSPDEGQMLGLAKEFASRGLEVPDYYSTPNQIWIETDTVKITIDTNRTVTIKFTDGLEVPFPLSSYATQEELTEASSYLWEKYGYLVDYDDPQYILEGGDYTINGDQAYTLSFYDAQGDCSENFVNYSFNRITFHPDVGIIHIQTDNALEEIGLYPLISEEEAIEQLLVGNYYTSVTEDFPGEDYIVRCELIYRVGSTDAYLLPFYHFYVYLPDAPRSPSYPDDIQIYGAYYVPAIDPAYLE